MSLPAEELSSTTHLLQPDQPHTEGPLGSLCRPV